MKQDTVTKAWSSAILCLVSLGLGPGLAAEPQSAGQTDLEEANLAGIDLRGVNLAGARLRAADLRDSNILGTILWSADLTATDLRGAKGLSFQQLASARWDPKNPPSLDDAHADFRRLWEGRRLQGVDLHDANLWSVDLQRANLTGADLRSAVLISANLQEATLVDADLGGTLLAGADLSRADLTGVKNLTPQQLLAAKWNPRQPPRLSDELNLYRKLWEKRNLIGLDLSGARLWLADLSGARLTGANLSGAVLIRAKLDGADLSDADLGKTVLTGADLSRADLRGARNLTAQQVISARWDAKNPPVLDAKFNVVRRFLESRKLQTEDLHDASLWAADLRQANLKSANLAGAVLIEADLRQAKLTDARLDGALLEGADLSAADLRGVKGLTPGQLASASWQAGNPPVLDSDLDLLRRLWEERDLQGKPLVGARLWGRKLGGSGLVDVDLSGAILVGSDLRGARLMRADLKDAVLAGADISGADLRGARNFTAQQLLAAVWEPGNPPILEAQLDFYRRKWEEKDLRQLRLAGAMLQGVDSGGVMGPVDRKAGATKWHPARPPKLGLDHLIGMLRRGETERMYIGDEAKQGRQAK